MFRMEVFEQDLIIKKIKIKSKEMSRSNELKTMARMLNLIKEKGTIHNYDLRNELNISKSQYNSLKPDLEHQFGWCIKYDKSTKCWFAVEDTEEKT